MNRTISVTELHSLNSLQLHVRWNSTLLAWLCETARSACAPTSVTKHLLITPHMVEVTPRRSWSPLYNTSDSTAGQVTAPQSAPSLRYILSPSCSPLSTCASFQHTAPARCMHAGCCFSRPHLFLLCALTCIHFSFPPRRRRTAIP